MQFSPSGGNGMQRVSFDDVTARLRRGIIPKKRQIGTKEWNDT